MKTLLCVPALVLLASLSACGGGSDATEQRETPFSYSTAKEAWTNAAITDYQFTLDRECYCLPAGPNRITVKDGKIQNAIIIAMQDSVKQNDLSRLPTLSSMFDTINNAYQAKSESVKVSYNTSLGFPEVIQIDYDQMILDGGVHYRVTDFSR